MCPAVDLCIIAEFDVLKRVGGHHGLRGGVKTINVIQHGWQIGQSAAIAGNGAAQNVVRIGGNDHTGIGVGCRVAVCLIEPRNIDRQLCVGDVSSHVRRRRRRGRITRQIGRDCAGGEIPRGIAGRYERELRRR